MSPSPNFVGGAREITPSTRLGKLSSCTLSFDGTKLPRRGTVSLVIEGSCAILAAVSLMRLFRAVESGPANEAKHLRLSDGSEREGTIWLLDEASITTSGP